MNNNLILTPKDLVTLIYQCEDDELAEKVVGIYTEQQINQAWVKKVDSAED